MSQIQPALSKEIQELANNVISLRQQTSVLYHAMAACFQRDQLALKGFEMHFWRRADKVEMDARRLMRYVIRRGGRVQFQTVPKPTVTEWKSPLDALKMALQMEQKIQVLVIQLVETALKVQDPTTRFVESIFLQKQTKLIKKIANTITMLQRNGPGLGEFAVDKHVFLPLEHKRQTNIVLRFPRDQYRMEMFTKRPLSIAFNRTPFSALPTPVLRH